MLKILTAFGLTLSVVCIIAGLILLAVSHPVIITIIMMVVLLSCIFTLIYIALD